MSAARRQLVLVGGGHAHVCVLKRLARVLSGWEVTLVGKDVLTPYSGMIPGYIAGHYSLEEVHIDLVPLARHAHARWIHDEVIGLDTERRELRTRDDRVVPYDLLSLNTGSTPRLSAVGATDHAVAVKPIARLAERWQQLLERVQRHRGAMTLAVVGAGASGVEMVLSMQHSLAQRWRALGHADETLHFRLFSATPEILPTHPPKMRRLVEGILERRGITVHREARVQEVHNRKVVCATAEEFEADEVLWATEAGAAPWLVDSGLDLDEGGFVRVTQSLQSCSHPQVFAAGDVASVVDHPCEKAGVFAVRQGPLLEQNLRRFAAGQPLHSKVPQRHFLSIVSTGRRHAVAARGAWCVAGGWVWYWKRWLDQRFMNRFRFSG